MAKMPYNTIVRDGRVYAEVSLRDMLDACDLSDTPVLAEVKRLYDENDELRELLTYAHDYIIGGEEGCKRCPICGGCESLPRCTFPEWFDERVREMK